MNSNSTVRNGINSKGYGQSWFLARNLSAHNTASAVDITIKGQENNMPSVMHELSTKAIKYEEASNAMKGKPFSEHAKHYAKTMTASAARLDKYMTDAGLEDLASEWWHFQDTATHNTISSLTGGKGATFWSNV